MHITKHVFKSLSFRLAMEFSAHIDNISPESNSIKEEISAEHRRKEKSFKDCMVLVLILF